MTEDTFEIPEFLRVREADMADRRAAFHAWKRDHGGPSGRRERRKPWGLPKTVDATANAIAREVEREKEQAKRERLAKLRGLA